MTDNNDDVDRDAVFVDRYLQYASEKRKDAAVAACIDAGIKDYRFPVSVVAERTLERLMPAIKSVQNIFTPREVPTAITAETLKADMQEVFQKAVAAEQFAAAIKAKEIQGRLVGLLTADGPTVNVNINTKTLTDSQLQKIAAGQTIDGEFKTVDEPARLPATKGIGSL